MDDKQSPAMGNPAPGTVPAPEEASSPTPAANAEQGVGSQAAAEVNPDSPRDSSETAAAEATEPAQAETPVASQDAGEGEAVPAAESASEQPEASAEEPAASEAATEAAPEAASEAAAAAAAATAAAAARAASDQGNEMTMEDVLAASDEQLARKPVHRGMITTGTIIMLAEDGIVVDVGAKIEGILPYGQLFEFDTNKEGAAKYFKAGDEIQVYVVRSDIPNSTIVLSKKRADQERAWNLLQEIHEKEKPVEVEIVEKVRGGLVANLGVRAFLPASQVDIRRVNDLAPYVGRRMKVKIIELNRRRNRVIISRRSILEEEISHLKEDTLKKLEPGAKLEGEVVEITDFGVFVNLGGIDGLVHRSELTHGRFSHPRDVVKLGDKVRVEVLDMDLERERINLSMKTLAANPWENVLTNYTIGQRVAGTVTNLTPFGAFVEIEPGLEGLIHVSEMSWTKRIRHPKEIVDEGQEVEAMILKIDTQQQRISLGLRQTQPDPWSSLPDRYPPGTEITGPVTGITDFGVFMEIEEGIEGLVHISELSHDHIENISEHFNKGDEITAVILNIDPVEQRASLSRKRMLPFTPENAAEFGGNAPAGGAPRGGYAGAGAGQQAGGRRGRRGRRSEGIDYDYSYVADAASSKTTTKLGDVYADLFAQFGLGGETKAEEGAGEAKAEATAEATAESAAPSEAAAATETADTAAAVDAGGDAGGAQGAAEVAASVSERELAETAAEITSEAAGEPAAAPAAKAEPVEAEAEEVDAENAIDAAEAAALLTAAFRQGKRPAKQAEEDAAAQAAADDVTAEAGDADDGPADDDAADADYEEETHA